MKKGRLPLVVIAVFCIAALGTSPAYAAVPANDNVANAQVLATTGGTTGDTTQATTEGGESPHGGSDAAIYGPFHSVWFAWSSPSDGTVTFDTCGSSFDTTLSVYRLSGSALTAPTENDNGSCAGSPSATESSITGSVRAGQVFRVALDGRSGAAGNYHLNWSFASPRSVMFQPQTLSAVTGAASVATGDLNRDGYKDMVVLGLASSTSIVAVLLGSPTGVFAAPTTFSGNLCGAPSPHSIALADLDRDGKLDVVATCPGIMWWKGNGDGTLQAVQLISGSGGSIAIADMNRDGIPDIVAGASVAGSSSCVADAVRSVSVITGRGDGTFLTPATYPAVEQLTALTVADLNRDGYLDVATVGYDSTVCQPELAILGGNGIGTLNARQRFVAGCRSSDVPVAITSGDLDGDAHDDLVLSFSSSCGAQVMYGQSGGRDKFSNSVDNSYRPGSFASRCDSVGSPTDGAVADLDRDGRLDVVVACSQSSTGNGASSVGLQDDQDSFAAPVGFTLGRDPRSILVADLNGDARSDMIAANKSDGTVTLLLGADVPAPASFIDSAPPSRTRSRSATFSFHAESNDVTFACSVDGSAFPCESPFTVDFNPNPFDPSGLRDGLHMFQVQAVDSHSRTGQAATTTWTVDAHAPTTTITSGPADGSTTRFAQPDFGFNADEASVTFACRVDAESWRACSGTTSDTPAAPLPDGIHHFEVRATDDLGNVGEGVVRAFSVDTTPPTLVMGARPAEGSKIRTRKRTARVTFTFTASDPTSCSLDGAPFASCTSPTQVVVGRGAHAFEVQAVDAAGNITSVLRRFRVVRG